MGPHIKLSCRGYDCFPVIIIIVQLEIHSQWGLLTKICRNAQPPHEISTQFHCFHQMNLASHHLTKIQFTATNRVKLPLHNPFLLTDLRKHQVFLGFKNTPQT